MQRVCEIQTGFVGDKAYSTAALSSTVKWGSPGKCRMDNHGFRMLAGSKSASTAVRLLLRNP